MTQDEIIEMALNSGLPSKESVHNTLWWLEAFAKLVAAHAVAKDRKEFDIDELCARQNKIGYKQGYNAGVLAEREACANLCEEISLRASGIHDAMTDDRNDEPILYMTGKELGSKSCADAIRARGEA